MTDMPDYTPPEVWDLEAGQWRAVSPPSTARWPAPRTRRSCRSGATRCSSTRSPRPNGVKVTLMLEELLALGHAGAEYDAWLIRIHDGEQFGSGFVAVNPNSKIPALMDRSGRGAGPRVSSPARSCSIWRRSSAPSCPWTLRCVRNASPGCFWQMGKRALSRRRLRHFYAYAPAKFEYAIDRFAMEVKRQLDVLDRRLAENEYLAGGDYTIADMAVWPWYGRVGQGAAVWRGDVPLGAGLHAPAALGRPDRGPGRRPQRGRMVKPRDGRAVQPVATSATTRRIFGTPDAGQARAARLRPRRPALRAAQTRQASARPGHGPCQRPGATKGNPDGYARAGPETHSADVTADEAGGVLPHAQVIRDVIAQGVLADEVGVDFFGVGEHHRADYAVSSPEIVLAAVAGQDVAHAARHGRDGAQLRRFPCGSTSVFATLGRGLRRAGRRGDPRARLLHRVLPVVRLRAERVRGAVRGEAQAVRGTPRGRTGDLGGARCARRCGPSRCSRPWRAGRCGPGSAWAAARKSIVRAAGYGLPVMLAIIGGDPARFRPFVDLHHRAAAHFRPRGGAGWRALAGACGGDRCAGPRGAVGRITSGRTPRIGAERGWPPMRPRGFRAGGGTMGRSMSARRRRWRGVSRRRCVRSGRRGST